MQSGGVNMSVAGKIVVSVAIGGTAEALGGGKPCHTGRQPARRSICEGGFSNGAVTGAFVSLLNHAAHSLQGEGEGKIINDKNVKPGQQENTLPYSDEYIRKQMKEIVNFLDGFNQSFGFGVAIAGLSMENIAFLEQLGRGSFYTGLVIAAVNTDFESIQSVTEFGIGSSVATLAYYQAWALPFAAAYSVLSINKDYSRTLPKRAAEGYRMSNSQFQHHPYFRKK